MQCKRFVQFTDGWQTEPATSTPHTVPKTTCPKQLKLRQRRVQARTPFRRHTTFSGLVNSEGLFYDEVLTAACSLTARASTARISQIIPRLSPSITHDTKD